MARHRTRLHDRSRERRVAEVLRELLAVGEHPAHEVVEGLRQGLVLRVLVDEEPRERRDRIHALANRMSDRQIENAMKREEPWKREEIDEQEEE